MTLSVLGAACGCGMDCAVLSPGAITLHQVGSESYICLQDGVYGGDIDCSRLVHRREKVVTVFRYGKR